MAEGKKVVPVITGIWGKTYNEDQSGTLLLTLTGADPGEAGAPLAKQVKVTKSGNKKTLTVSD